jgi:predicted GIY-YIG superfamily endonuclease
VAQRIGQLPSGRWRVRWWERGKRISRSLPTEAEAEEFREAALAAVAKGQSVAHLRPTVLMDSARLNFDAKAHYVYLLCDAKGEPIYVGRSSNVFGRIGQHMQVRERRAATKAVSLIPCDSVAETKTVEMALIKLYRPPLNVYGLIPKKPRVLSRRERFVRAERERQRRRRLRSSHISVTDPTDVARTAGL